ncbi:hypothetical protein AOLI_G00148300 [Acnodon oligacanthus]
MAKVNALLAARCQKGMVEEGSVRAPICRSDPCAHFSLPVIHLRHTDPPLNHFYALFMPLFYPQPGRWLCLSSAKPGAQTSDPTRTSLSLHLPAVTQEEPSGHTDAECRPIRSIAKLTIQKVSVAVLEPSCRR